MPESIAGRLPPLRKLGRLAIDSGRPALTRGAIIAALALAFSLFGIASFGYQIVYLGFLLLMLGVPV
jgi:hypothetical protein